MCAFFPTSSSSIPAADLALLIFHWGDGAVWTLLDRAAIGRQDAEKVLNFKYKILFFFARFLCQPEVGVGKVGGPDAAAGRATAVEAGLGWSLTGFFGKKYVGGEIVLFV